MSGLLEKVAKAIAISIQGKPPYDELVSLWEDHARAALHEVRKYLEHKHDYGSGDHWDAIEEIDEALK